MKASLRLLPLAAILLAPPVLAQAGPIERALADPARSAAAREQDAMRKPAEVLAFAGVRVGDSVADFMAGNGYFTELLGRLVGPRGTVYALNPPSFHDPKDWEKGGNAKANIRTLVVPVAQMQLAPASIDVLFAHHTYHDLYWESERFKYPRLDVPVVLVDWFRAVKPGGHVVIVDHVGAAGDPRAGHGSRRIRGDRRQ